MKHVLKRLAACITTMSIITGLCLGNFCGLGELMGTTMIAYAADQRTIDSIKTEDYLAKDTVVSSNFEFNVYLDGGFITRTSTYTVPNRVYVQLKETSIRDTLKLTKAYSVTLTGGDNATPDGDVFQYVNAGSEMTCVTYTAAEGYHFEEYSESVNDVTVTRNMIYTIRGQQVMLDSDLAMLYQVETKVFNQTVNRNIERFPQSFRFQLTKDEFDSLRSQIVTSNERGGRRYRPYVFTEQGIAMLSGVLRSDVAIQISIHIMNTFVEMRHFISSNELLFEKISHIELKQLEYQKSTDDKFNRVFKYIDDNAESEQKIFFDGQIYDAFSLLIFLIKKAKTEIILIDGYADVDTLNILAKKNAGVNVKLYTYSSAKLTNTDVSNFNTQYPSLTVKKTQVFHDRFLILDSKIVYHIGASLKDAGKKCFGISKWDDQGLITDLLNRLKTV